MIHAVSYDNMDQYGGLFAQQFKLRHQEFITRQSYDVKTYNGMEYDQYDTPAACYLTHADATGRPIATSRLTPVKQGCMLKDLWPHLVEDKALLNADDVWEGTRYCIDKNIDAATRTTIIHKMAIAYLEFGLRKGLHRIIGMMPTYIYRSVFERPGIEMEYLGPVAKVGRHNVRAVAIPVERKQLENVREKTGIYHDVLAGINSTNNIESECLNERAA